MAGESECELKRREAAYWDRQAEVRTQDGQIPLAADIRRATRVIPMGPDRLPVDPRMSEILAGEYHARFIDWVAHKPGGRVLEVGCGPGWLALELGRRGQIVDGYDLSPGAIAVARRMLAENPYRDGFGQVNYYVQDATSIDLGREKYDAVSAYSALHHLPNLREFMDRVWLALKPGGIVATVDDMPEGRLERGAHLLLSLLLPSYHRTYGQKLALVLRRLLRTAESAGPQDTSPLEGLSTQEVAPCLYKKFEVVEDLHFNAFVTWPLLGLRGPDRFRYGVACALVRLDRLLCRMGAVKGVYRMVIARKKVAYEVC